MIKISNEQERLEPFLRWVGGKKQILHELLSFLPHDLKKRNYHEPFFGAGALYFAIRPEKSFLSDVNDHLMKCYEYVCDEPAKVSASLIQHKKKSSEEYYYKVREKYNSERDSPKQAARFIYLNKTCFNGIFRVNLKDKFNVPYGHKDPPFLPDEKHLLDVGNALKRSVLKTISYEKALTDVGDEDFVYLDPPYPPLNGTSNFRHYTKDRFNEDDQKKLAELVKEIDRRGAKFMLTNADIPLIRSLYNVFPAIELSVIRYVSCKQKKHRVSELLIKNY